METKGQVRKMKENQWKTQGKASQTEKPKKKNKKNPSPILIGRDCLYVVITVLFISPKNGGVQLHCLFILDVPFELLSWSDWYKDLIKSRAERNRTRTYDPVPGIKKKNSKPNKMIETNPIESRSYLSDQDLEKLIGEFLEAAALLLKAGGEAHLRLTDQHCNMVALYRYMMLHGYWVPRIDDRVWSIHHGLYDIVWEMNGILGFHEMKSEMLMQICCRFRVTVGNCGMDPDEKSPPNMSIRKETLKPTGFVDLLPLMFKLYLTRWPLPDHR